MPIRDIAFQTGSARFNPQHYSDRCTRLVLQLFLFSLPLRLRFSSRTETLKRNGSSLNRDESEGHLGRCQRCVYVNLKRSKAIVRQTMSGRRRRKMNIEVSNGESRIEVELNSSMVINSIGNQMRDPVSDLAVIDQAREPSVASPRQ